MLTRSHRLKRQHLGHSAERARRLIRGACIGVKVRNAVHGQLNACLEVGMSEARHALEFLNSQAGAALISRAAEGLNDRADFKPAPCPGVTLADPWLPENAAALVFHMAQAAVQRLMRGQVAWFETDDTFACVLRVLELASAVSLPFAALLSTLNADGLTPHLPLELRPVIQPNAPSA